MTSKTSTVFPVVAALASARVFGKARSPWEARGKHREMQERYLPLLEKLHDQCRSFSYDELKTIASNSDEVINDFLKENGFNIQLEPFTDPNDFGAAAILNVLVKWKTPGCRWSLITPDQKQYDAARLEDDILFTAAKGYSHPVVHIACENGDTVHLTVADHSNLEGLDLLERVSSLTMGEDCYDYDAVVFPMVDLDQEVDISFFCNMGFHGTGAAGDEGFLYVKEAKQQTKFKMNHLGAKVKSAAAFAMTLECMRFPKPDLEINQPFYSWMTRPGVDVPYFAGYIGTSDWKDPGGLDENAKDDSLEEA